MLHKHNCCVIRIEAKVEKKYLVLTFQMEISAGIYMQQICGTPFKSLRRTLATNSKLIILKCLDLDQNTIFYWKRQ